MSCRLEFFREFLEIVAVHIVQNDREFFAIEIALDDNYWQPSAAAISSNASEASAAAMSEQPISGRFQGSDRTDLLAIPITEQYILTMNRSNTMSDLSQRAAMFVTSVSSALVALAFVAQATKFGWTFQVVSCAIFATLYLLGLQTYVRSIQQSIEDMHLACGVIIFIQKSFQVPHPTF